MIVKLDSLKQSVQALLSDNASAILTAGGVVGTVGTAVLTGRATAQAVHFFHEADKVREEDPTLKPKSEVYAPLWLKVKYVGPYYIPPVLVGSATIASIIMANRISAKRAAALAAAYGISERSLQEYKERTLEKLGATKEQKLRDEIAQDRVSNTPNNEVIVLATGQVLCYDMLTGRYFQSTVEDIKKAQNKINQELLQYQTVSLSQFFDEIGLPSTTYTEEVGWNTIDHGGIEVQFSTVMSPDDKPCIAIDFNRPPKPDYHKLY